MDDTFELREKVKKILKNEISDYLPDIPEENSLAEASIIESTNRYRQTHSNTEFFPLDEKLRSHSYVPLNNEDYSTGRSDSSNRIARVINLAEASNFFKLNEKNNNLLWEAIERNDLEEVNELLAPDRPSELTPQINAPGLNNWTALHMAAALGSVEICEILISQIDNHSLNSRTSMNRTPLHLGTIHNHLKIVMILVNKGAKIDLVDNDFNSCLHYASNQGYLDIVEFLLVVGSNIYLRNNLNRTPIEIALNYDVYKIFEDYCKEENLLIPESNYARTFLCQTLRHNSREDQINKLLFSSKVPPRQTDLKLFNERPKLEKNSKKKYFFKMPEAKVGPYDFNCLLQLGRGSFGQVFLVEKKDTLERFALKVLDKEKILLRHLERYAFTERNILMKISHPFIVKLYFAFQTPEKLALVMDYCPNGDLSMTLQREKRFSEDVARFYIAETVLALEELHSRNIIFRDLKPDNILIDEDGHIKLADFGLSKEEMGHGQLAKSFCGSAAYFAPEMVKRDGHSKSIDWYVLGAMLYEMLMGKPPYYSPNRESLYSNIKKGDLTFPSEISNLAKDLITKLLKINPKKRLGASKLDAEEIKTHGFFEGVDWKKFLSKNVTPPVYKPITRMYKKIPLAKVYGKIEEEEEADGNVIQGWSVLEKK